MKIVINSVYGYFSLSYDAVMKYARMKGIKLYPMQTGKGDWLYWIKNPENKENMTSENLFHQSDIPRNDSDLVQIVESMRYRANNDHSRLKVIEIPDDVDWMINEYDGKEWVEEKHRTWGKEEE
jgi:hypothetical protein